MNSWVEHFKDGGWGMFPTLVFGIIMIAVAIRYAAQPSKRFVPLMTGLGVLTMASGGLGFVTGMITVAGAVGGGRFGEGQDGRITLIGFGESLNNVAFALIFVVLASILACYGAWRLSNETPQSPRAQRAVP